MAATLRRRAAFAAIWKTLTSGDGPTVGKRLVAIPRMFWRTLRGQYDGAGRLLLLGLTGAYIASPIDAVPELLLGPAGLVDDAVAIAWLAGAVLAETERFLEWERVRDSVIDGSVAE